MKKMCLILLLVSACGSNGEEESPAGDDGMRAEEQAVAAGLADPAATADPAQLQALVAGAMAAAMPDAKDVQYRNVRPGSAGAACGEVARPGPRNAAGPFLPFVVTPEGLAVIGTTPTIAHDDPLDPIGDTWLRWCASPEELNAIAERMRTEGPAKAATLDVPPPIEPIDLEPTQSPPAQQPQPAAPPADRAPPPPPQIDSFFNSVQRDR